MITEDEDTKKDEIINVKLPRADYELLRTMIESQKGYNWLTGLLKNSWIWIVGGGVLTVILLYDRIHLGIK